MDEDATGLAVGSLAEQQIGISRSVAKNLVANYTNTLNMGLVAFHSSRPAAIGAALQRPQQPVRRELRSHELCPTYTGPRTGPKRRFRAPNLVAGRIHATTSSAVLRWREPRQRILLFDNGQRVQQRREPGVRTLTAIALPHQDGPSDGAGQRRPGSPERLVELPLRHRLPPDRQRPRPGNHGLG